MAKLRVKLPNDFIDSLMITKHSYRKVSKFRKKIKGSTQQNTVSKTMGRKMAKLLSEYKPP